MNDSVVFNKTYAHQFGVWMYFFNHNEWVELYAKNCSRKTSEQWYQMGYASVPLGTLYLTIGVVCELVYIPFMIAMLKPEFIKYSCYKFMFLIGAIDIFVVPCNAIITGVQCILGLHFCHAPAFFYFVGAIASSGFYGVTLTCVILAFDRFFEMCFPSLAKFFFGGNRIYIWLPIPVIYYFVTLADVPFLYNSKRFSYFTDPFTEVPDMQGNPIFKELTFHCIHNSSIAAFVGGIYITLVIVLYIKSKLYHNMTLQSCCICIEMWIAALVYIYNQFWPLPNIIEIMAQVSWIGVHGDTPIVYLLLNSTLRKAVMNMLVFRRSRVSSYNNFTSAPSAMKTETPGRDSIRGSAVVTPNSTNYNPVTDTINPTA